MKRIGPILTSIAALGNLFIAWMLFRSVHLVRSALAMPLDANSPITVFFVRVWWWPLIFSFLLALSVAWPRIRQQSERLVVLVAVLLGVEVMILVLELAAFVVPLSHVPTAEMIEQGAIY